MYPFGSLMIFPTMCVSNLAILNARLYDSTIQLSKICLDYHLRLQIGRAYLNLLPRKLDMEKQLVRKNITLTLRKRLQTTGSTIQPKFLNLSQKSSPHLGSLQQHEVKELVVLFKQKSYFYIFMIVLCAHVRVASVGGLF